MINSFFIKDFLYDLDKMETTRQKKYARLIQKDLSVIFQANTHELFGGAFITVTHILMSPDLKLAKAYLSFMLVEDEKAMLKRVNTHNKRIRTQLAQKIKKQARVIPELRFYLDDTAEIAAKVDALFRKEEDSED